MIKQAYFVLVLLFVGLSAFGQTHELADSLWNEAGKAAEAKNTQRVAQLLEEAALSEKKTEEPRVEKLTNMLRQAGVHYWRVHDRQNAIPLMEEAVKIYERTFGKGTEENITNKVWLSLMYKETDQYDRALTLYLEVLEEAEESLGKSHSSYGAIASGLAELYRKMGEYTNALPLYIEAVENTKISLGKSDQNYRTRLYNLAGLYLEMGEYDQALPLYLEAKENAEQMFGKQHPSYISVIIGLAALYRDKGQYDDALSLYMEALEGTERTLGKSHEDYGARLGNLAGLYRLMGRYDKALTLFQEALENTEKSLGKSHVDYGSRVNSLGGLYRVMGQYDKALPLLQEALENIEKNLGKSHKDYGVILNNIAVLYSEMGQYDKALPIHLEALDITEKNLGKSHADYGRRLSNLALLYNTLGQYDRALSMLHEAKENTENSLGTSHPDYGTRLNSLAGLYSSMGQYDKALPLYLEALSNTENGLGRSHADYGLYSCNLASLYESIGQYSKALSCYRQSLENLKHQILQTFTFLSEAEKEHFIKKNEHNFEIYQNFFAKYSKNSSSAETAYDIELLTKGLILSSSQQMRQIIEQMDEPEVIELYDQWFEKKSQLAKQYSIPINERSVELKQWESEAENLERQLVQRSSAFTDQMQIGKINWQDVQNKLKPNEVAIEFAAFQYHHENTWTEFTLYTALVLRKDEERPQLIPLFEQSQLDSLLIKTGNDEALVSHLYRGSEAQSTQQDYTKLYDLVWEPLEAYLQDGETVYFAPSGTLHQIAFSAIVAPDGKFLSDKYTLRQVSTTAKILQQNKTEKLQKMALFGGIDYEVEADELLAYAQSIQPNANALSRSLTEDLDRGGASWNYLPGTLDEVETIRDLAQGTALSVDFFNGKTALEETFKSLSGKNSPNILHVATHGFFFPDPEKEYRDHQLMMEEERNVFKLSDNPLNRSGLLFAGANHTWRGEKLADGLEDGILTAYEASHVSLPNTELVVLSACETGLGDIKGSEGVFGLQRAFKSAGANYLLMSLWKVPDTETAEFMEKFYEALFADENIEQSFAEAQSYMKTRYPSDPYKWAAFVLVR